MKLLENDVIMIVFGNLSFLKLVHLKGKHVFILFSNVNVIHVVRTIK